MTPGKVSQHLRAWFLVASFTCGLRLLPFRRWRRWFIDHEPSSDRASLGRAGDRQAALRLADAVARAGRLVPFSTCLSRALAAHRLLVRAGHPSRVEIGVRRDERREFEAHAWVDCYGVHVLGDSESQAVRGFTHLKTLKGLVPSAFPAERARD